MTLRAPLVAALALTALAAPAMAAAPAPVAPLSVVRVSEPANLTQGGDTRALATATALAAGDVVSAGPRGKVGLQFAGNGALTLSSLGDLQVFEAQPARGKQLALAKLKLLGGALRVDSRGTGGKPAQDVRLNVGSLKSRITNAYAWAANTAEGDTLCLLAGSVSVQTGGSDERLTTAGSCLRREPDGQLSRFTIDSDPVVTGAIDATRFSGDAIALPPPAPVAVPAAAPIIAVAPPAPVPAPAPTPAPAAAPVAPATAPALAADAPPAPTADAKGWTVVVLSLSRAEPVTARAKALTDQGLPAATRSATVNGMTMHRVIVGSFATQAQARSYAGQTLAKNGIKGWPAPL